MKRLFVAVEIPEDIKDAIEWELLGLRKFFPPWLKMVSRENWHITLSFLGDQEEEKIPAIKTAIESATREFFPPSVKFTRIHFGPNEESPRMIWIFGESLGLGELKRKIDRVLKKAGIVSEKNGHNFSCHITLARLGDDRFHMPTKAIDECFRSGPITLKESFLKRSGAEYETLESFSFGKPIPEHTESIDNIDTSESGEAVSET